MRRIPGLAVALILMSLTCASAQPPLQTPAAHLGYRLGERYTPHHQIVSYFRHVAAAAPTRVSLQEYGKTYEGRPLMLAYVSSAANLANLEAIRANNLRLTGLLKDGTAPREDMPVIVWLSYNVHGNEPSSSEAAMKTVHRLLDGSDPATAAWLEKAVVVIDPCINPDGRDRYANWQNATASILPDANPQTREHREPWPGGRTNHYYFDLNRDWAWQSQVETQQRMKVYNRWLPQVHVDFHEQSPNSPYYFAPAAQPYHEAITPWQREFQQVVGRNNARYFDRNGWLYFTKERFDLFYPSYGDTYPTYNGAIGMTYEQGGGPRGGRAVAIEDGDTLTLADRIEHHFTTGLSTIEASVANAERLKREFRKFFSDGMREPTAGYRYFLVRSRSHMGPDGGTLGRYLRDNGIEYGYVQTKFASKGFDYSTGRETAFNAEPDDIVIPVQQPKSTLVRVLFEPEARINDSATYDITAWALPYALGLEAYAVKEKLPMPAGYGARTPRRQQAQTAEAADAYAYVIPWNSFASARLLASLLRKGVKVRYAEEPFESGGRRFERGSLIVTRAANRQSPEELRSLITKAVAETPDYHESIAPLASGFVDKGYDLGSGRVKFINPPRVALMAGEGTVANSVGEVWHYFERQLGYPVSMLNASDFNQLKLSDFDVLIMPEGNYRFLSDKNSSESLRDWIRSGGRVIALESAVAQMAGLDWAIKKKKTDEGKDGEESKLVRFEDREKEYLTASIPGAIYRIDLDNSHPLAYGYPSHYHSLRQDAGLYEYLKEGGWNVGVIGKDGYVTGFAGVKAKQKLRDGLVLGVQESGRGQIVYFADNPVFRSFWESGKLMLANAVFLVGQ
jgi:hypothetical protein